jgi:diguanylate cyclase (GGDEF)-like protein/PAS domain S-box-containing protein
VNVENPNVGSIWMIQDISQRRREAEMLIVSESRYQRLFETAKDGILILDAESGKIADVNLFLIDLLGYSREQFIEKEIWEIGFFKDVVANQEKFSELQQKQYIRYEDLPLETAKGQKIHVEFVSNVYLVEKKKVVQCNVRDVSARKEAEEKLRILNAELEKLAGTDGLTNINNHRSLLQHTEREFEVAARYLPPLTTMFFDIDDFKQVNDIFGHAMGDESLKKMIQIVCAELRSTDVIGRYVGDEFVILLPQTSAQESLPLAERIHASVAAMRVDTELTLTISIGIAQTIHDVAQPDTVEALLLRADQALYAAKQAGKNRTEIFSK